jgi:hypothetical protein
MIAFTGALTPPSCFVSEGESGLALDDMAAARSLLYVFVSR